MITAGPRSLQPTATFDEASYVFVINPYGGRWQTPGMTLFMETAQATLRRSRPAFSRELIATLRLAAPIALTQLGQIAMMTTDLALIGRLGDAAVAAAALAHTIFFVGFTLGMGLVSAVAPLAAQAFGAGQPHLVRQSLHAGLWATILISVPMLALPLYGDPILRALGQSPATAHQAQQYLFGLAWGIGPGLAFLAIRGFMGAVNRPQPGLWIMLAAIPANAALVYLLIHGVGGLPQLGLLGAGLGTSLINGAMLLAALWVARQRTPFRQFEVLKHFHRIDGELMRQLFAIGAPIAVAFLLEYGVFGAAGLLMGLISTTALAAHQVALQVAAILFMVPFGIGMAATVRVGHAAGRGDAPAARQAGIAATMLGVLFMSLMTLIVLATRFAIAHAFFGQGGDDEIIDLTATLLVVGSSFFVADGIQTIVSGALRGLSDTRLPLLFAAISYWLIGFATAWGLAFPGRFGAIGVWIGLSCGTAVYALLLLLRFQWLSRRAIRSRLDRVAVVSPPP